MIDMESYHRGFSVPISGKEGEIMRLEQNQPYKICPHCKPRAPEWMPYNPIGVCMCDALRCETKSKEKETK